LSPHRRGRGPYQSTPDAALAAVKARARRAYLDASLEDALEISVSHWGLDGLLMMVFVAITPHRLPPVGLRIQAHRA
jgi:hypothetical protein